jgi:hypothetical protein
MVSSGIRLSAPLQRALLGRRRARRSTLVFPATVIDFETCNLRTLHCYCTRLAIREQDRIVTHEALLESYCLSRSLPLPLRNILVN